MKPFSRYIPLLWLILGVILLAWFFAVPGKAQTPSLVERVSIYGFKGLNTADGLFAMTPDYSPKSVNVDYSRYGIGTIGKRWGFDSAHTVAGSDSIVGFGTYQRSNRQSCLVYATDTTSKGYGCVWATRYGSDNPDSARLISTFWSIQNPTTFSQFNDKLYITNGQQAGIVWDGTRARRFPLQTPGLPLIIPMQTAGELNGEYRYCIFRCTIWKSGTEYTWKDGTLSPSVFVKNGQVMLRDFSRAITDSIVTSADSAFAWLGRTKANPGPIDDADTIWLLQDVCLKVGGTYSADTATYVDSVADTSLYAFIIPGATKLRYGRDSASIITGRRFGAPTFISSITDSTMTSEWQIRIGAFQEFRNCGYAYAVTITDTLSGLESDTTRALWVQQHFPGGATHADSIEGLRRITIGLPRVPAYDSGLILNIYRSQILVTDRPFYLVCGAEGWSTLHGWICIRYDTVWTNVEPARTLKGDYWPLRGLRADSGVAADWHLVGQVPVSQTQFTDSIRSDSARLRARFNLSTQPEIFAQVLQWKSQLLGVAGSRIWSSNQLVDSQGNFGTNTFDDFDRNDGDFITAIWETQFGLVVKKNRKGYVLPSGGGRPELVSTYGCVAPLSHIRGGGGDFYVGDGGVYFETEGQQLERVYNAGLISDKLNNFVKMDDTTKRNIAAFWIPDKQQAIFGADFYQTANDTAYVYDRRSNTWTTWTNLVPKFGCLYSKNSSIGSPPSATFYFTKAGGNVFYTYATSDNEATSTLGCTIVYETAPLFPDADLEQVDVVGLITTDCSYGVDYVYGSLYSGDSLIQYPPILFDSLYTGYRYMEFNARPATPTSLYLFTIPIVLPFTTGGIEGIEIIYRKAVERQGYR